MRAPAEVFPPIKKTKFPTATTEWLTEATGALAREDQELEVGSKASTALENSPFWLYPPKTKRRPLTATPAPKERAVVMALFPSQSMREGLEHFLAEEQKSPAVPQSTSSSQVPPVVALVAHLLEMHVRGEEHWVLREQVDPAGRRHFDPSQVDPAREQSTASSQAPPAGDLLPHFELTQTREEEH